ncbi:MAG: hypothetical protein WAP35_05705 [Solirubrobacterales bacterium]
MNTHSRVAARPSAYRSIFSSALTLLCAVVLTLVFAVGASAAVNATVNLRIEAPDKTLFNGPVSAGPGTVAGGVDTPECRANAQGVNYSKATVLTAIQTALGAGGYRTSGTHYSFGTLICSLGGHAVTPVDYWFVKNNNSGHPQPAGYVSGDTELENGDDVLVYFQIAAANITKTLDIKLPANAQPGQTVTGSVAAYDNDTDAKSPAAGATVAADGAVATTDAQGEFKIALPKPGKQLVTAEAAHAIRASTNITIDPATPAPIVKINRFVRCARTYKKSSRKHRRCVRIVRAKQRAEKRRVKPAGAVFGLR